MINSEIYYNQLQKKYSRKITLGLSRIRKALLLLGSPELKLPQPCNIIGSDGKYTTGINLLMFIEASGKTVSHFVSPHLFRLESRFWLKNRFIKLNEIKNYEKMISKLKIKLSLFELLTVIHILAASKAKAHYNLIEAGLLFAKDSTRLWKKPLLQVCTNLNLQHKEWIYPKTINEVVRQKCGYLSNHSNIYIGKQKPKVLNIVKKILKKNKSKIIYPSKWKIVYKNKKIFYKDKNNIIQIKSNYIHSNGLIDNLGLSIKIALDLNIKPKTIEKTIPKISYDGRIQYIKKGKLRKLIHGKEKLLLDGCHSNQSASNLYNYLKQLNVPIYGLWGMQKNKFPHQFLKNFNGIFKKVVTFKIDNEPNAMGSEELKKIAIKLGYETVDAKNFKEGLKIISSKSKKIIVVFGSLYGVGSVLKFN